MNRNEYKSFLARSKISERHTFTKFRDHWVERHLDIRKFVRRRIFDDKRDHPALGMDRIDLKLVWNDCGECTRSDLAFFAPDLVERLAGFFVRERKSE